MTIKKPVTKARRAFEAHVGKCGLCWSAYGLHQGNPCKKGFELRRKLTNVKGTNFGQAWRTPSRPS